MITVDEIDRLIARGGRWMPRWGWHDDHRAFDKTPDYLAALLQVRSEFATFLNVVKAAQASSVLQLGLGPCDAPHAVWQAVCGKATTIDLRAMISKAGDRYSGADTHSKQARMFALLDSPYDILFIDAGHSLRDVMADEFDYAPMVRPGGIVAFHDALPRDSFPELGVPIFLKNSEHQLHWIGEEVGIAWYKT